MFGVDTDRPDDRPRGDRRRGRRHRGPRAAAWSRGARPRKQEGDGRAGRDGRHARPPSARRVAASDDGRTRAEERTMADRIVIDPVTRIEGHLRIEAQVDGGKVTEAYSSGTMFRGMELILKGTRPARGLDLGAADLRRLHHRPRPRVRLRGRGRPRDRDPAERPADPQPDRRRPAHPGPRHPLLPPARARLGRRRRRAQGRSRRRRPRSPSRSRLAESSAERTSPASRPASRSSSTPASSASSPAATGATRPTSCRPRRT